MAPHSYRDRATPAHVYDRCVESVKKDSHSLAGMNPSTPIYPHSSSWGIGNSTTRFYTNQNHYRASGLKVHFVGEVVGPEDGTKMGALGGTTVMFGDVFSTPLLSS